MIHHASIGVEEPATVATFVAGLTGARSVRAPSPPFFEGSWFVLAGDGEGSFVEVTPACAILRPDALFGVSRESGRDPASSHHVLLGSCATAEEIEEEAARYGWQTQRAETGLFEVIKVWVDGAVLVEFLPKEQRARYVEAFGKEGLPNLDRRLRDLEAGVRAKLQTS